MYGSSAIMAPNFFSREIHFVFLSDRVMDLQNKSVVDFFFTPLDDDMFKCTCNKRLKQPGKKGNTNLTSHLKNIQSVTLKLQEDSITTVEVRRLFDALILMFNSMCKYLNERAEIVDNPQFEAAISKSFTVSYEDLKLPEKVQLRRFRTQQEASLSNAHVETGHKSKAKNIRTPLRNKIFPMNFEENLYLAVNKNYWDVELLLLVVNSD